MESGHFDMIEEKPITASGAYEMMSEVPDEVMEVQEQGTLLQRLDSKNWKTRSKAFQEVLEEVKLLRTYPIYSSMLPKFLTDPNPNPQEKALEILRSYIENSSSSLLSHIDSLVRILIEKYVSSNKSTFKDLGKDLISHLFILDKDQVLFELSKCCEHKNLKFQAAALISFNTLIEKLGVKTFEFKKVLKIVEKSAENTNALIRTEALNFYKELYKIIGEGVQVFVVNLKKPQQEELNKAFASLKVADVSERMALDCIDAKDIFIHFNEKWTENVMALEKWSERKEALEELNAAANYPKLVEKSSGVLVSMAKRLINDSNIHVVIQIIKLIGNLAQGQKKFFEPYAKMLLPVLLSKFRDKKAQIIQETHNTLDLLTQSLHLDSIPQYLEPALQDKACSSKLNTMLWIQRTLIPLTPHEETLKHLFLLIKSNIEDSIETVRDLSCELLNSLIKKHKNFMNLLSDLSEAKQSKIFTHLSSAKKKEKQEIKPEEVAVIRQKNLGKTLEKVDVNMIEENSVQEVEDFIPIDILRNLNENSWKAKEAGLKSLKDFVGCEIIPSNLIRIHGFVIRLLKGFKENNPNLVKEGLEVMKKIYMLCTLTEESLTVVLSSSALDKLADNKLAELYKECLLLICEIISPIVVVRNIITNLQSCTKPKTLSEALEFLAIVCREFGSRTVDLNLLIEYSKSSLTNSNPIVKKSSVSLFKVLFAYLGDQLFDKLSSLKESIIKSLKEEISKNPIELLTVHRKLRCKFAGLDQTDLTKKTNISQQITPLLLSSLSDSNWKTRREALEKIEKIVPNKLAGNGLAELFRQLKARLSDSNKALIKLALGILGKFAEALGSDSVGYARVMVPGIIKVLGDKQNSLRQEAKLTLDKWGKHAGPEHVINECGAYLLQDSPEIRNDLLQWVLSNRDSIKNSDLKSLIPGVISCLQDKVSMIRNQAELVFGEIMEYTGTDSITPYLKDIKPAILRTLQDILAKYTKVTAKVEKKGVNSKTTIEKEVSKALLSPSYDEMLINPKIERFIITVSNIQNYQKNSIDLIVQQLEFLQSAVLLNFSVYSKDFLVFCNQLTESLFKLIHYTFSHPFQDTYSNFIQFMIAHLRNIFCSADLLKDTDEVYIENLYEEIIGRIAHMQNDEILQVSLSNMLISMFEHSDINKTIEVLFLLMRKNKSNSSFLQINFKCILKIARSLRFLKINTEKALATIQRFLIASDYIDCQDPCLRTAKTLLKELVFIEGENIWGSYSNMSVVLKEKNQFIKDWINEILIVSYPPVKIFKRLAVTETYGEALIELCRYVKENKNENFDQALKRFPDIAEKVLKDLEMQQKQNSEKDSQEVILKENRWPRVNADVQKSSYVENAFNFN